MTPPVFPLLKASAGVTALLGSSPLRLYAFGLALEGALPYATWFVVSGQPENYLGELPDTDSTLVQIDIWAATADEALDIAREIRDALETAAYMTDSGTDRDVETQAFRYRMDFAFYTDRSNES